MGLKEQFRDQGLDLSWLEKVKQPDKATIEPPKESCGLLTLYYLADHAYTCNSKDGSKYLKYRDLPKPQDPPVWYCKVCKGKFDTWEEALNHPNTSA